MKIQCDVCNAAEASVFCCADEAALCAGCDRRVHRANKLASKHRRFSLLHPSSPAHAPRCDVCQEKRAFLFCQEDRAILCRDCDAPIHTANELTRKHNRFLLTGVKLSSSAVPVEESEAIAEISTSEEKRVLEAKDDKTNKSSPATESCSNNHKGVDKEVVCTSSSGSSSISEYLIKVLPGWHVEDLLLDSAFPTPMGFSKAADEVAAPFLEADLDSGFGVAAREEVPIWWVPQVSQVSPLELLAHQGFGFGFGFGKGGFAEEGSRQRWCSDDGFTVPEISHPPSNKRLRPSWYT